MEVNSWEEACRLCLGVFPCDGVLGGCPLRLWEAGGQGTVEAAGHPLCFLPLGEDVALLRMRLGARGQGEPF